MEQYILLCLDCHEIFPGRQNHTCRRNVKTDFASKVGTVDEQFTRLHGTQMKYSIISCFEDGSYDQSLIANGSEIIPSTEVYIPDRRVEEIKPNCVTSIQETMPFHFFPGDYSFQQQVDRSREGLPPFQPERQEFNLSATHLLQDGRYNPCTSRDVANLCPNENYPMSYSLPSASPWNVGESAGPSNGTDLLEQCEPMGLEAHRRAEDRHFVCPICQRRILWRSSFEVHYRTHTGEKPYECDFCDKRFRRPWHLTRHRRIHTGEKPYACDMCEHKTKTKYELEQHLISHTRETSYNCPICGKTFKYLSSCKTHIKNVLHKK